MFFMALTSSFLVRKGLGNDWVSFALPRILWVNTLILLASSVTIQIARARSAQRGCRAAFQPLVGHHHRAGRSVSGRSIRGLAPACRARRLSRHQSEQQLLLCADGVARPASFGRNRRRLFYVSYRHWQRSRISQSTAADLASIYWHFMDGLWIFLFALLYLGR